GKASRACFARSALMNGLALSAPSGALVTPHPQVSRAISEPRPAPLFPNHAWAALASKTDSTKRQRPITAADACIRAHGRAARDRLQGVRLWLAANGYLLPHQEPAHGQKHRPGDAAQAFG